MLTVSLFVKYPFFLTTSLNTVVIYMYKFWKVIDSGQWIVFIQVIRLSVQYKKRQEGRGRCRGVSRLAHEGWQPASCALIPILHLPWILALQWPPEIGKKKEDDKDEMNCVDYNRFRGSPSYSLRDFYEIFHFQPLESPRLLTCF